LVKQRTQLVNMIRGLLAEFGIDIPRGLERALLKARQIADGEAPDVPAEAIKVVLTLSQQVLEVHVRVPAMERDVERWHRGNELSRRLATIPGIGPIGASALAASVTDPQQFRSGRQFAAWLGPTPLQKSSGGKERLGRITKMGDKYLRKLLIVGMTSLVRRAKYKPETVDPRLANWLARKPVRVATVAMANKAARVVWAIMTRGEIYRPGHVPVLAAPTSRASRAGLSCCAPSRLWRLGPSGLRFFRQKPMAATT
jgi:transposase